MKVRTFIIVGLTAVAGASIAFWPGRDDTPSTPTSSIDVAQPGESSSERSDPGTALTDGAVELEPDQPEASIAEQAVDSRLARRLQNMEDSMYQLVGASVVQGLIESGLALADSEEIARRLVADIADCAMDSLRIEAERQSISVDELLTQLEAAARNNGDPFDVADVSSLEANAFPCQAEAMQRAGIPYQSGAPVSDEEIERLRECIEDFNNSDIVDRGVILEICGSRVFGETP